MIAYIRLCAKKEPPRRTAPGRHADIASGFGVLRVLTFLGGVVRPDHDLAHSVGLERERLQRDVEALAVGMRNAVPMLSQNPSASASARLSTRETFWLVSPCRAPIGWGCHLPGGLAADAAKHAQAARSELLVRGSLRLACGRPFRNATVRCRFFQTCGVDAITCSCLLRPLCIAFDSSTSLVRPLRSFLRPGRYCRGQRAQARSRLGAMPCHFISAARRRLDGAEHAGTLSRTETMAVAGVSSPRKGSTPDGRDAFAARCTRARSHRRTPRMKIVARGEPPKVLCITRSIHNLAFP